jgi:hypothetical protein
MQPSPNRDGVARALAKFARTPSIDFARRANHPTACPAPFAKIFWFTFDPNHLFIFAIPAQHRGAFRDRHERRAWDAMDAVAPKTNGAFRGRRSCVVLTPRRRRQVGERNFTDDGDKKARSPGRARNKPLKPLRAGMPGDPGATVVTNSCAFYLCARGCGCNGHPAFPTPSMGEGFKHNSGASRRGKAEAYPKLERRHCERSEAIHRAAKEEWIALSLRSSQRRSTARFRSRYSALLTSLIRGSAAFIRLR